MKRNENAENGGLGFATVLFLIFMVLKLTDLIDWSWWWITAPLWIPFGILSMVGLIIWVGVALICWLEKDEETD